ncbi:hydrogenase expression protein HypE [Streptomyces morookaense]|uniref:Hydrogenase expression protein HypE n=1 Tax=Streptomyces morookaense TaxID=1970 RepID=A0A7Y7E577_STRMO|nr:hydrogenase expression protein HypE [Streptomyces morookaense]NVK76440.1 hydrogenase expression protein HypE [Streptomyces morookaense]GHF07096.1 hydrogenase expression protein HypE [Streptomyces morookaense]
MTTDDSDTTGTTGTAPEGFGEIDILWISEGMSCDGDTVSMTASEQPAVEDLVLGLVPGLPKVNLHNKVLSPSLGGEDFLAPFRAAARGELAPFILVIEGSVPNQNVIEGDGYWTSFGNDPETGQPLTLNWWIDQLAPKAWAVVAAGTCAAYGGIHAMAGNPTGCMGLADYLGRDFRSQGALPVVNVPGCPIQPENFMETLTWVLQHAAGSAPPPPLDHMLRPQWLFGRTVHEGCDRAAYYEQGDFALDYNSPKCQVKVGCWGPVVNCNVPKRGWMSGVGGCPNVGGICIGCTMPGFPDAFMPFMDEPSGGAFSSMLVKPYGALVRRLRGITNMAVNREPRWHHNGPSLTTGYDPTWRPSGARTHGTGRAGTRRTRRRELT